MKIVELDSHSVNPGDLSWEGIEALGELTLYDRTSPEEVVARAQGADAVLINKIAMTRDVIEQLPDLKYIGELATGFNNIDLDAAHEHGITVTNIPAYSTDSVAQMVFAHMLNVAFHVQHYADDTRAGVWSRNPDFCYWDTPLTELSGKVLGIVGLGNIGSKVARIAHEMGMYVQAVTSKNVTDLPEWMQKVTLEGLFNTSDVITLHCPLTADNTHMIDTDAIAMMKPSAIVINTGRGPLVDEDAMAEALNSGRLQAYCADVMASEPPRKDNPLLSCERAFITPHIAWATLEARQRLMSIAVANLQAFIDGTPQNIL